MAVLVLVQRLFQWVLCSLLRLQLRLLNYWLFDYRRWFCWGCFHVYDWFLWRWLGYCWFLGAISGVGSLITWTSGSGAAIGASTTGAASTGAASITGAFQLARPQPERLRLELVQLLRRFRLELLRLELLPLERSQLLEFQLELFRLLEFQLGQLQ